ncbi:MAG: NAD(P)/FAD-dependent oxidoreductase [Clostridia bacterium]|jgi:hypothetical protein
MTKKVIVVGAGPAGLMAAGVAAERGNDVILIEKNKQPGKKLLISGKGRCNITNDTDIDGLVSNTPGNGDFLYSSFYSFSNKDIINFLNDHGLETKVERGNRVFPVSDNAEDVANVLLKYVKKSGVTLKLNSQVTKIKTSDNSVSGIILKTGDTISCDSLIIATGGLSYPKTGSTGDGYKFAKELGHKIDDLKPSLVPLTVKENWVKDLQGISLRNVGIKMKTPKGKTIYEDFGEMLFTHFGVSGPIILSSSRHISDYGYEGIELMIDLKPALSSQTLDLRIQRDFEKYSKKQFKNSLDDLLPKKMIPVFIMLSGIDPEKFINQITREERKVILELFKNFKLTIEGTRPINEAIVTAGGINCKEINPSTMESKIVSNLFFAGEIIDVDAYTGGFNLTIAFSTGHLAGSSC